MARALKNQQGPDRQKWGQGLSGRKNQEGRACDGKALVHLGYHESSLVLNKLGGSWGVRKASTKSMDLIPGQ